MTKSPEDLRAALGTVQVYTFSGRQIMSWPTKICENFHIDETVSFLIFPENDGFKLVIKRKEESQ